MGLDHTIHNEHLHLGQLCRWSLMLGLVQRVYAECPIAAVAPFSTWAHVHNYVCNNIALLVENNGKEQDIPPYGHCHFLPANFCGHSIG